MLFSSLIFIAYFLPAFLALYFLCGMRTAVVLAGSVVFYTWGEGLFVLLLAAMIALNYVAGLRIGGGSAAGRAWLYGIVAADLAVLGVFKYADFCAVTLNGILGASVLPELRLRLPLGISFFTFQLISYLVDVHRGVVPAERRPAAFATYILMFPHLIAGPIVRYADIRDELARSGRHVRIGLGLQYFIVGLCQKVLVANSVAPVADHAFGLGQDLDATMAWVGIAAYTIQIYFDFCGYSNMAIGLAFMLGFTFPKNFDHPYAARSLTDFWRRWHMSLSFWFRDYVYIPLGGNRLGPWRTLGNLLVVFLLTGLWHGAAWTFVAWGLFHGGLLLVERIGMRRVLERVPVGVASLYTLLMVMVGWVVFRAESLTEAGWYLSKMTSLGEFYSPLPESRVLMGSQFWLAMACGGLFSFPVIAMALCGPDGSMAGRSSRIADIRLDTLQVPLLPVPLLVSGFILSMAMLAGNSLNPFLYFRF